MSSSQRCRSVSRGPPAGERDGRGRRKPGEQLQGRLVVLGGVFVGQAPRRPLRGANGVRQGAAVLVHRRRREEMMGELGEVRLRIVGVQPLEDFADAAVMLRSRRGAELVIQGLAHQGMREAVPARHPRPHGDEPSAHALVEHRQQSGAVRDRFLLQSGDALDHSPDRIPRR